MPTFRLLKISLHASWLLVAMIVIGIAAFSPGVAVLVVGLLVAFKAKQRWGGSTAHGSARWGSALDIFFAGGFGKHGLYVGQVVAPSNRERMDILKRAPRWMARDAVRTYFARRDMNVRLSQGVHTLVCAPAGAGKSVGVILPFLLECPDSCVVIDIKGELYGNSNLARRRLGSKVVRIDPFNVCGPDSHAFSPLDMIDPSAPDSIDKVRALATAMLPRDPAEKEPHWITSAQMYMAAFIAYVLVKFPPASRNLQTVMALMSDAAARKAALAEMLTMPHYDEMLARMAGQLEFYQDKELGSVLSTFARSTQHLNSQLVRASTARSTFEALGIRDKMTVYLVLPPHLLKSHNGLLRMWLEGLMQAVMRGGADESRRVHFVCDEAAALGHLDVIETAICQLRGYGVRMLMVYQSIGQLKTCFSPGQDVTILSNMDNRLYFGVNDYPTAEDVSRQLGQETIVTTSVSGGSSRSKSRDHQGHESTSYSTNDNWSAQEIGRSLLQPSEVLQLDQRACIVFSKGCPPIMTYLARYYEKAFRERLPSRFMMFCRAAVLAATMFSLLAGAGVVGWLVVVGR